MSELKSIELLNRAVADELATVHQYMYFHFHLDDQGVEHLTDPIKILAKAAEMEKNSTRDYNKWARECAENLDAASKKIFEELVGDEEMHFGAFDKQQEHIRQFGPAYLALQSFGKEAPAGAGA